MEARSYCERLREDMTGWKAKLYDIIRKAEKASPADREKFASSVDELNRIVDGMEGRIQKLERECPLDFEPERAALEEKSKELAAKSDRIWSELSPDDFE